MDFKDAFRQRIEDVAEACVGCGKCFEICPITGAAGLEAADAEQTTLSIRDLLRDGPGDDAAASWARACILSGDCLSACDYGVNPRLMLAMARTKLSENATDARERRRNGVKAFAGLGRDVKILSRIQLTREQLARLGQSPQTIHSADEAEAAPDVVLYTGCNVLKTPHIALLSLDIFDKIGVRYKVLGGPSHCCGVLQFRAGDVENASRMGASTIERFERTGASEVVAWCASCQVQFSEINLPNHALATGEDTLPMRPYMRYLAAPGGRAAPASGA